MVSVSRRRAVLSTQGMGYAVRMTESAFELLQPAARRADMLFVCDHASNKVPASYGTLGLEEGAFAAHIAHDIGATEVTRTLAEAYGAPAVLAGWSRLLIDLNRGADDPTLVMKLSDGRIIPGNRHADGAEVEKRLDLFYRPYHAAIAEQIAKLRAAGVIPTIISMHSFTPVWKGFKRPWDVGVLWDKDGRLAHPLMAALKRAGFTVGDNEPYKGELEGDCMYVHGSLNGLPHVLIEIRQDLIATPDAAAKFAARLKPILDEALQAMGPAKIQYTRAFAAPQGATQMDEKTRTELEAAAFRRLVAHLRERTDVQNIDLMNLAGFCRNCLGDWYREAAAEKGIALEKDRAREIVYGMPPAEWKMRYQKEASPEQKALFERASSSDATGKK
jgi:predicted N-formylglutamate amidohydrolase